MTLILKIKPQKYIFQQNMAIFSAANASFWTPARMGMCIRIPQMKKEVKKKVYTINSQNKKQAIGIQVTFILENKLQKNIILPKYGHFFSYWFVHFVPLLRWKCA